MSGPIVRKYGFPNFEKIFGERPILHGSDAEQAATEAPKTAALENPSAPTGERKSGTDRTNG